MNRTVAFCTLGCKVNIYESDAIWNQLELLGFEKKEFHEKADVYIINTCSVTNMADRKSRKMIREAHRTNPDGIIAVMGCYSQISYEDIQEIEGVKVILGTSNKQNIIPYILEALEHKEQAPIVKIEDISKPIPFEEFDVTTFSRTRAELKIEDGCNNFCSYCIIPYARGRIRSKSKETTLEQAKKMVELGYKEIVLTGIHTGAYGTDLENYSFSDLVTDLLQIEGLERLRISSLEINQIDDKLLELIRTNPKLAHHLHLPLQSGCDTVLKRMNRHYDTSFFLKKIQEIREASPDIAITTDVIVGFPGETEEEYQKTKEFIKKVNFFELHVFPFSSRKGTVASKMPNQISGPVKSYRCNDLISLSEELSKQYIHTFIGKDLFLLPEEFKDGMLIGHTSNYIKVAIEGEEKDVGEVIKIKLVDTHYPISYGIIEKN